MTDEPLLRELRYLGVDERSILVLALLPLCQVAWADGEVQPEEREKILEMAQKLGIDAEARALLEGWLTHPPSATYIERGRQAMMLLTASQTELYLDTALLDDVIAFSQAVASAAGGFMGFRKVGPEEAAILEQIADALHVGHTAVPVEWQEIAEEDIEDEDTDVFSPTEMAALREAAHIAQPTPAHDLQGDHRGDLIHHGADGGVNFPFDDQGLSIGRSRKNLVQIPHDHGLSRVHCRIEFRDDRAWLVDNGTTNGSFVNGERVVERRLFGGEQIRVGESNFTFLLR